MGELAEYKTPMCSGVMGNEGQPSADNVLVIVPLDHVTSVRAFGIMATYEAELYRVDCDGVQYERLTGILANGESLEVFSGDGFPKPASLGDFDGNGEVEFADFLILSGNFGKTVPPCMDGDADGKGVVEFADFLILSANFGSMVDRITPGEVVLTR